MLPIRLRPTAAGDLPLVLALERAAENSPYIGRWTRAEHADAIARRDREHWIVADANGAPLGYAIAFDLVAAGHGVYVKRIVAIDKSRGVGRAAIAAIARHTFAELRAPHLWLTVFSDNLRAQRAYAAAGLEPWLLAADERAVLSAAVGGFSDTSVVMRLLAPDETLRGG